MKIKWVTKHYSDLTRDEIFEILRLRARVFIMEQNCPYIDPDDLDKISIHLMAWEENHPQTFIAYGRVTPPGSRFKEVSMGRIVTAPEFRKIGLGKELVEKLLKLIENDPGPSPVRISAQAYLEKYYGRFGFVTQSQPYLEDNIPHVEMLLPSPQVLKN